jgi:outer membrane lipoprotein-sorting protein
MRRLAVLRLAVLAALVLAWQAASPLADAPRFNERQLSDLKRVSAYLNSMRSLTGRFLQLGPDGTPTEGTFYLKKPGRMRFEYDKPSPVLVIADGFAVVVQNLALRTTNRYPLIGSPLRMLLSDDVDLSDDDRIRQVRREPGALSVTARQDSGPAQGQITITFADAGGTLELRQWEVIDAQGLRTLIVITSLRSGVELSPQLFVVRNLNPRPRLRN